MACILSGKASSKKIFQARLQLSASRPALTERTNSTNHTSNSGWTIVVNGRLIPYDPPLTAVLDFLVSLHDRGFTYTTINTARRAISAVALPKNNMTMGSHLLVSRFMKGVYKDSQPTPRYQSTWDVQPALT